MLCDTNESTEDNEVTTTSHPSPPAETDITGTTHDNNFQVAHIYYLAASAEFAAPSMGSNTRPTAKLFKRRVGHRRKTTLWQVQISGDCLVRSRTTSVAARHDQRSLGLRHLEMVNAKVTAGRKSNLSKTHTPSPRRLPRWNAVVLFGIMNKTWTLKSWWFTQETGSRNTSLVVHVLVDLKVKSWDIFNVANVDIFLLKWSNFRACRRIHVIYYITMTCSSLLTNMPSPCWLICICSFACKPSITTYPCYN